MPRRDVLSLEDTGRGTRHMATAVLGPPQPVSARGWAEEMTLEQRGASQGVAVSEGMARTLVTRCDDRHVTFDCI